MYIHEIVHCTVQLREVETPIYLLQPSWVDNETWKYDKYILQRILK